MDATSVAQAGVLSLSFLHEMKIVLTITSEISGIKGSFFMFIFFKKDCLVSKL
jgi:hypothetical protein